MSEDKKEVKSILDQIAAKKNIEVQDDIVPAKTDKKDLGKKIAIIAIILAIYSGIMAGLFITKNLIFVLLIVAFIFAVKPLLKLLRKIFHIENKNSDIG